jgi:hypothetical protein
MGIDPIRTMKGFPVFDDDYDVNAIELSPEVQAELDAYRAKLDASTTRLDVSLDEYLDYLYELPDVELCELDTDRAFNEWKTRMEYTRDCDFLFDVLAFISAKHDISRIESELRVLTSVARNGNIPADIIQELMGMSSTYKLGLEEYLAECGNLTDTQAVRLANLNDKDVDESLTHNRELPHAGLKALASRQTVKPKLLEKILSNPSCTPDIRKLLDPEAVAMFDDYKSARLISIAKAEFGDDFWKSYEATYCFLDDMVAAMNPNIPYNLAGELAARRDEVGAVARHMMDAGEYVCLQFEHDLDDDDLDDDDGYDFDED